MYSALMTADRDSAVPPLKAKSISLVVPQLLVVMLVPSLTRTNPPNQEDIGVIASIVRTGVQVSATAVEVPALTNDRKRQQALAVIDARSRLMMIPLIR